MRRWLISAFVLILVLILLQVGVMPGGSNIKLFNIGDGKQIVLRIGPQPAYGVETPDYVVDGTDDHVQAQAALDALPAGGGKLEFEVYNYDFSVTVARAIDNIIIEGMGYGAYFANDGVTALFSVGTQANWVFSDFQTDAGGLTLGGATNYTLERVQLGGTYYQLYASSGTVTGTFVGNLTGNVTGKSDNATYADLAGNSTLFDGHTWGEVGSGSGGSSPIVFIAALNATATERAGATVNCTGSSDDVEITAALAANSKVITSSGVFECDGDIVLNDNNVLLGQGSSTIYNFSGGLIDISNVSDVEIGCFTINGTPDNGTGAPYYHTGAIHVEPTTTDMDNLYFHDIIADTVNKVESPFMFQSNHSAPDITNVLVERCTVLAGDGTGFKLREGDATDGPFTFKNFTFRDCIVKETGLLDTRYTVTTGGFDYCESLSTNITVENILFENCVVEGCYDSAFFCDSKGHKLNVNFVNCRASDNWQSGNVSSPGAGFAFIGGTVTASDCISENNHYDYMIYDYNDPISRITLNNPVGLSSSGHGITIPYGNQYGKIIINGGRIEDSGQQGMLTYDVKNLYINGLQIINPTGYNDIGVNFNTTGHALSDSVLDMIIVTPARYAVYGRTADNITISGSITTTHASGEALQIYSSSNINLRSLTLKGTSRGARLDGNANANMSFQNCLIKGGTVGIVSANSTDLMIQNTRFLLCTMPIDINNASVIRPVITGNNWYGNTANMTYASATNPLIKMNVGLDGLWFTETP